MMVIGKIGVDFGVVMLEETILVEQAISPIKIELDFGFEDTFKVVIMGIFEESAQIARSD